MSEIKGVLQDLHAYVGPFSTLQKCDYCESVGPEHHFTTRQMHSFCNRCLDQHCSDELVEKLKYENND